MSINIVKNVLIKISKNRMTCNKLNQNILSKDLAALWTINGTLQLSTELTSDNLAPAP